MLKRDGTDIAADSSVSALQVRYFAVDPFQTTERPTFKGRNLAASEGAENAGMENAGVETTGEDSRGINCRSGRSRN